MRFVSNLLPCTVQEVHKSRNALQDQPPQPPAWLVLVSIVRTRKEVQWLVVMTCSRLLPHCPLFYSRPPCLAIILPEAPVARELLIISIHVTKMAIRLGGNEERMVEERVAARWRCGEGQFMHGSCFHGLITAESTGYQCFMRSPL